MAEWPNAAVLKTVIPRDRDRGFESHSLLQFFLTDLFSYLMLFFNIYSILVEPILFTSAIFITKKGKNKNVHYTTYLILYYF